MKYEVIFDVAQGGFRNGWFPAVGLIFFAVGISLAKYRAILPTMFSWVGPKDGSKLGFLFLALSVLWMTVAFTGTWRDYAALRNALKEGTVAVVEGRVENFVSVPHKTERFSVCGASFAYSSYGVTAGFNKTNSFGGPIREGLWVRIAHFGNSIARLEIVRQGVSEGARCRR
jgi:hypothetical protein